MQNIGKEWLVRTRTGEILGPFTQRELLEELQKRTFTPDDEIAPSHGYWISAQTLTNREADEFTLTHTRNHTTTKSIHGLTNTAATPPAGIPLPESTFTEDEEDLTPTPDSIRPPPPMPRGTLSANEITGFSKRFGPLLVGAVTVAVFFTLLSHLKRGGPKETKSANPALTMHVTEGESPFVRKIYAMIHAGATQAALKELTQYHEKHPAKGDDEYLIPYAALLITEGESPAQARKFLEQVLNGPSTPRLKSRAHHWLGYLLLSQDEGDMGESHFLEALQLNPKDAAARFNLGRAYLKQEKYSQALDYLQLAELEVPDLWLVHIYKGRAKSALGNMEEARASFKTAVESSQDRWITYIYYSLFLKGLQDNEGAQTVLRRMLTRDPHYEIHCPPPWGFYQEKVNYAEYLTAFSTVMDKAPGEEKELGKLYINYLMNGANSGEGRRLEAVAVTGGLTAKVLGLEATLDRDASLDETRAAMSRLPNNLSDFGYYAYVLRGEAESRLSLVNEAQADFNRALTLEPHSAIAHFAMAALLKKNSRGSDAESEIKSLLLYHPNYIPAILPSQNYY